MSTTMQATTPGMRIPSYAPKQVKSGVRNRLQHLVSPHVDSFDYFLGPGMEAAVDDLEPMEILLKEMRQGMETEEGEETKVTIRLEGLEIDKPYRQDVGKRTDVVPFTPREAREAGLTYSGAMTITVRVQVDDGDETFFRTSLGNIPLMVMSSKCHLHGLTQKQLIAKKEEQTECGGYFLLNGIERVIRLLQVPRRNYAAAIERSSYKNRGPTYSDKGVAMRCVRSDQSSVTLTLHYLTNGGATLKFVLRKQEFLLPVVIVAKALMDVTDKELHDRLLAGDKSNTFFSARLEVLLRDAKQHKLRNRDSCRAFLGARFRQYLPITEDVSDADAGKLLISRFFFVHTEKFQEKLECLLHMMRKLFCFAEGKCSQDNADALSSHELLLPGHLLTMILKEKLDEALQGTKQALTRDYNINRKKMLPQLRNDTLKYIKKNFDRVASRTGPKIGTFLSTGNIVSSSGLDLQQVSGFTIVAERLNIFRYHSHFQSVHRGQFFTTMKTTAVRKLLPESWGFLCPVHTPDGSPCGLLNHLSRECVPLSFPTNGKNARLPCTPTGRLRAIHPSEVTQGKRNDEDRDNLVNSGNEEGGGSAEEKTSVNEAATPLMGDQLKRLLCDLGMVPVGVSGSDGHSLLSDESIPVVLDGTPCGGIKSSLAPALVAQLRVLKCTGGLGREETYIDPTMEIAYLPKPQKTGHLAIEAFPGLYLHTQPGRMIRPVLNLDTRTVEYIGPMEQVHMQIACLGNEVEEETKAAASDGGVIKTTHCELSPTNMLSQVAALTPFSDYNQSPRNMYQCQMGKQTMGTPAHALQHRADNKLYRIQTPQSPIVQTQAYRDYGMDEYAQGTNAVVCVISYTGYDMEDAMIINKAAFERGFGYGSMYKTFVIDLEEEEKKGMGSGRGARGRPIYHFNNVKKPPVPKRSKQVKAPGGGEGIEGVGMDGDDDNEDDIGMAGEKYYEELDSDGLPLEGEVIDFGQPLCCFVDAITGEHKVVKHKESERAYVQTVRCLAGTTTAASAAAAAAAIKLSGGPSGGASGAKAGTMRKISITLRFPRRPIIGDKFSSRHGQKGTLSVLYPQESMPFTESGMSPDILINPHAFPSRMTIGMLIESMAGKSGALQGIFQDGTPFNFHEQDRAVDYIGQQLAKSGYNYYGSEPMYNGQSGQLMQCDIFVGLVYYQRLRHMVSDKSQVRATGPVTQLTRQPVKGRKKHGGIRLGEMERDALLSHGVAFSLHDRLMACSDSHVAHVCTKCGGFIGVHHAGPSTMQSLRARAKASGVPGANASTSPAIGSSTGLTQSSYLARGTMTCSTCLSTDTCQPVNLPYVYRYLANELAGMGVKISLKLG